MLTQKGRLSMTVPNSVWIRNVEETGCFQFAPIDNILAELSVGLDLHPDPADRFIAATAYRYGATLVTKDRKLHACGGIKSCWT